MGFTMSWLAVRGIDKNALYDRLGVVPTGEIGISLDHPITGQVLNDWTIVVFDELAHRFVGDDEVKRLSAGCTIMACNLCETTMCSTANLWENGEMVWGVCHFIEEGWEDLETTGDLPAEYQEIESHFRKLEADEPAAEDGESVDYMIEVPVELAAG
jgi:hypothetical protein